MSETKTVHYLKIVYYRGNKILTTIVTFLRFEVISTNYIETHYLPVFTLKYVMQMNPEIENSYNV